MAGSALDRVVVRSVEIAVRALWGFTPRVMEYVVADLGPWRAIGWMAAHMPRYQRTLQVLGPLRTHLACLAISLVNGCRYCAFGQGYALDLLHLRDRDALFPVDAQTLSTWIDLAPDELRARLHVVLEEAGLHAEVVWLDSVLDLATGAQTPIDGDEARVAHLVVMIGQLNRVGIAHEIAPDEAHDPVNKDAALRARHAELRAT
jgi:hypothetical protein